MHDPKFEKAVQRKMEELEFVPSESVWENIEMAVTPRVRRRAVALYWWFLVPGLLLLGGGTILYKSFGSRVAVNTRVGVQPQPAQGAGGAANQAGGSASQAGGAGVAANQAGGATNLSRATASNAGGGVTRRGSRVPVGSMETGGATGSGRPTGTGGATGTSAVKEREGSIDGSGAKPNGGLTAAGNTTVSGGAGVAEGRQHYNYRPGLISCYASSLGIRGPRLPAGVNKTAVGGIKKPDRSWQAGFTGGIGFSSFNESLLDRISVVSTASTFNALAPTSANRNASNYGASKDYVSNIQPDLSFYAGVFAQKPLSSRWSVSVGLNMHYYSSRIRVGQQVNYYVPSTSSLISVPAALSAIQPYPSYSTGDDQAFINRYYYLEVPASVEWRINRSRVLPLFWRGGVVLSELMGSNALYYNNQSGVYLKDNGVINHTQLSFSSGLMAALPFRNIRIQAGPEFQYGVTNLLKTASGSGHLFYGGMRLAFMR
jgi:hypothetical protein